MFLKRKETRLQTKSFFKTGNVIKKEEFLYKGKALLTLQTKTINQPASQFGRPADEHGTGRPHGSGRPAGRETAGGSAGDEIANRSPVLSIIYSRHLGSEEMWRGKFINLILLKQHQIEAAGCMIREAKGCMSWWYVLSVSCLESSRHFKSHLIYKHSVFSIWCVRMAFWCASHDFFKTMPNTSGGPFGVCTFHESTNKPMNNEPGTLNNGHWTVGGGTVGGGKKWNTIELFPHAKKKWHAKKGKTTKKLVKKSRKNQAATCSGTRGHLPRTGIIPQPRWGLDSLGAKCMRFWRCAQKLRRVFRRRFFWFCCSLLSSCFGPYAWW